MDQDQDQPDYINMALEDETFDDHSRLRAEIATAESTSDEEVPVSFLMSLEEAGGQPIEVDAILVFDTDGKENE